MKKYHFSQWLSLLISFVLTKLLFPKARLIRFPIDIRNFRYISLNNGFTTGRYNRIECHIFEYLPPPRLVFGKNVQINDSCHISCASKINIGSNVLIASRVYITDHDHGKYSNSSTDIYELPVKRRIYCQDIEIGNNVWIGEGVCILKGVEVGENSIIGSNSVITKSIPPFSIVAGNPARIIKSYKSQI